MKRYIATAALVASVAAAGPAWAACAPDTVATAINDCGPPAAGNVILDLAGTALPLTGGQTPYATETASFTATGSTTTLTLAFRNDPAFWEVASVSLTANGGPNLLQSGDFNAAQIYAGPFADQALPVQWSYSYQGETSSAQPGIGSPGQLSSCAALTPGAQEIQCWHDGAEFGYDQLSQTIATTAGQQYTMSLLVLSTNDAGTARQTAGGNEAGASDLVVYEAGSTPVTAVPEPGMLALLGMGLAGLVVRRRR